MCHFLKDIVVPIATIFGGFISGIASGILLEKWTKRQMIRNDFRSAILAVIHDLAEKSGNLDNAFVGWHSHSNRVLSARANYFIICEPKWWRKVEPAWERYDSIKADLNWFLANSINREEILRRLYDLLKATSD